MAPAARPWWDGLVLVAGILLYTVWSIAWSRREQAGANAAAAPGAARPRGARAILGGVALVAVRLLLLVLGGRWFVDGAVALARVLGVSDLVIGLTIVAAGTSMPEVA